MSISKINEISQSLFPFLVQFNYMSPEIYSMQSFDGYAVDLWAVGVILVMLLTGFQPWQKANDTDNAFRYMSRGHLATILRQNVKQNLSDEALDLMQRMLYLNPRKRLSINEIRAHPWMNLTMVNPMRG